jgi:hypothetical protein
MFTKIVLIPLYNGVEAVYLPAITTILEASGLI